MNLCFYQRAEGMLSRVLCGERCAVAYHAGQRVEGEQAGSGTPAQCPVVQRTRPGWSPPGIASGNSTAFQIPHHSAHKINNDINTTLEMLTNNGF